MRTLKPKPGELLSITRNARIRREYAAGVRQADLARNYGISPQRVSQILLGGKLPAASDAANYVYVMRSGAYLKVGVAKQPAVRLEQHRRNSPHDVEMLAVKRAGRRVEQEIHQLLAEHHHRHEWFHDNAAVRQLLVGSGFAVPAI